MPEEYTREYSIIGNIPFSGKVIYFDGFESGVRWIADGLGDDWTVECRKDDAYSGKYDCVLTTKATSPTLGDWVYIQRELHCRPNVLATLFFRWKHWYVGRLQYMEVRFNSFVNGDAHDARVRYDSDGTKWQYYDENMVWVDIPGGDQFIEDLYWADFSLKVDFLSGKYVSLASNRKKFDLSALKYHIEEVGEGDRYEIRITASTRLAEQAILSVDDVLVTS